MIKRYVAAFSYGNENVGDDIESRFWLQWPLEISAIEQVKFLAKLASGKLDIRPETAGLARELLRFDGVGDTKIYAKTGWVGPQAPQIGWWVGWVEHGKAVYPFALNIDIAVSKDAKQRVPIGLACLRSLGIIDAQ